MFLIENGNPGQVYATEASAYIQVDGGEKEVLSPDSVNLSKYWEPGEVAWVPGTVITISDVSLPDGYVEDSEDGPYTITFTEEDYAELYSIYGADLTYFIYIHKSTEDIDITLKNYSVEVTEFESDTSLSIIVKDYYGNVLSPDYYTYSSGWYNADEYYSEDCVFIEVEGCNGYTGAFTDFYECEQQSISDANVELSETDLTYTGEELTPSVTVTVGNLTLNEGHDYTVSYSDNVNIGTGSITITGNNYYTGTITKTFNIISNTVDISSCNLLLSSESFTYDGTAKTPDITAEYGTTTLVNGTDYTVAYSNNVNAGTATATATGIGNYTGTAALDFTIDKAELSLNATVTDSTIKLGSTTQITATCTGGTITSYESSNTSVATVDGNGLVTGISNGTAAIYVSADGDANHNSGKAQVIITVAGTDSDSDTGSGSESGAATDVGESSSDPDAVAINSLYNTSSGIAIIWNKISGADGYNIYRKTSAANNFKKIAAIDNASTVNYIDANVKNGTIYTYKVVPCLNGIEGTESESVTTARLVSVSLSSVKSSSSKKASVKWKKTTKVTGYQIQYSTSKKFKSGNTTKTVKVSGAKKTSKVISKLKGGKKYYFRVRTYKKVNGVTYYSAWSAKKSVKVKK
ncbi:MAG: fibronectin type III domain-containing protein [Lachnospiraceae bacterium]|nr:fibronectin type III domain-containing protein [Lachnospiraceae bacterium]